MKELETLTKTCPVSTASFDFLSRSERYQDEKPYYFSGPLHEDEEKHRSNLEYTTHGNIKLRDIRGLEECLSLEDHGFQFMKHRPSASLNDPDTKQLEDYLIEIAEAVKQHLNAEKVLCYTYRFRKETPSSVIAPEGFAIGTFKNQDKPVFTPHTDQTVEGGPRRIRHHLSEEECDEYLNGNWRIRIINCWRPIGHVVEDRPLAMCDYYSLNKSDLKAADRASREYVGEIYYLQHDEKQRWYWLSRQTPEEVMLFINYDSDPDNSPPYMAHSSFFNTKSDPNAKPRQSIETGLIVITPK